MAVRSPANYENGQSVTATVTKPVSFSVGGQGQDFKTINVTD